MTIPSGARLGAYEVLAPLGAGGMGEVYRGRDPRLGREVALKVLPEALAADRDRLSRFEQEARAASALNHPNIVTIYEVGREGETAFIAMELVDGRTLRELTASGPMPVRKVLNAAAQVADGLAKAHSAGIVHRDLKPENVMVSKDGFVKILDFGLAKLVEPESGEVSVMPTLAQPETQPGTVMGTVAYMSPEQASGEMLDFRSDQFSLGSMLYEMTTGSKAFQRKTAAETMSAIIREEPEPVGKLRPDLPLPVRWILDRCLAKDPEERYASTKDLARDLASVRDHISEASSGAELAAPGAPRRRALPLVAGLALLAAGLAVGWAFARASAPKFPAAPSFKRLTFRRGALANARFAPDGQTILYGASWAGEPRATKLYLTRTESPESRPFDLPPADILSVSSTGELAILLVERGVGTLARLPMAGGVPRQVLENVTYAGADWAPDGKDLVVVQEVDGKSRLEFPIGKVLLEGENVGSPRFSPRGDLISFVENGSLGVIDPLGKARRTLSSGWAVIDGVPCWRREGEEIWFTAKQEQGQPEALWAVDRSGKRRLVMRVPGVLELDDIARDGRVLIAHHTQVHSLRGLGAGQTHEVELSWLDKSHPSDLSSDGKMLLVTEYGEGGGSNVAIYMRATDGSPAVRLGDGDGVAISPDGKRVLAIGREKKGGLVLLPTGAGQTVTLDAAGLSDFAWGAWLPDGRSVVFTGIDSKKVSRIYVQAVPDGKPRPISPEGASIPYLTSPVSPDGKYVLGVAGEKRMLYPTDGVEQPRALPGLSAEDFPIQWSSNSRSIYCFRRMEGPRRVWLVDVATGQRGLWREFADEDHLLANFHVRVTPDGKSYVYGGTNTLSELYLVEGLR